MLDDLERLENEAYEALSDDPAELTSKAEEEKRIIEEMAQSKLKEPDRIAVRRLAATSRNLLGKEYHLMV